MVLKLYGGTYASSGNGLVAMVLAEKRISFELVVVDMAAKAHKTPEYLAMHPFGQVPVIDDNGFILCESRAICRYLADKYLNQGTQLFPADLKARALVEQAASFEFANFHPAVKKSRNGTSRQTVRYSVQYGCLMTRIRRRGLPVDHAVVEEAVAELSAKLDVYEAILGKHKFLAGDPVWQSILRFSLRQRNSPGGYLPPLLRSLVGCWWNEIISRPTWVKLKADGIKSSAS
ncbi:thioredoxin-like protein [Mycena vitilis]|nr:thioredoxin-like protein [Mycena vitilis]